MALVLLVLVAVFGRQVQVMQGQGERAAVQSSLGALRTALVVHHLQQALRGTPPPASAAPPNPFLLLGKPPANYQGEAGVLQTDSVVPGSWVFDPACGCIGYRPLYPQWLERPANAQALWFKVGAASGPAQITALERYVWQGQPVD